MIWLALAFAIDRVQLKLGERNYGSRFNGIGCIDDVNQRRAQAPMAYRVLYPWLIGLIEHIIPRVRKHRLVALYEPLKVLSIALLMALMAQVLGATTALVFAILVAATFHYDYWDWPFEVMAIVAGMSGDPLLTLGACLLAALSRETAILGALAYFCTTLDYYHAALLAIVVLCIQMAVRLYVGPQRKYWSDNMLLVNWNDIRELFDNHPFYFGEIAMAIIITLATIASIVSGLSGPAWPVAIAVILASWTLARVSETRVLASCLVFVALAIQTFI